MNHKHNFLRSGITAVYILLFIGINSSVAQSIGKKAIYRTWIELSNSYKESTGLLYQVMDSSIIMTKSLMRKTYNNNKVGKINIDYLQIESIKVRRKGRVGKGMLIGTAVGFGLGALIGSLSEDDTDGFIKFTKKDKIWINSIGLGTTGLIIGSIVGSVKIKIPIYGSKMIFQQEKEKLRKYSFIR
jgi:hypothetical protein